MAYDFTAQKAEATAAGFEVVEDGINGLPCMRFRCDACGRVGLTTFPEITPVPPGFLTHAYHLATMEHECPTNPTQGATR